MGMLSVLFRLLYFACLARFRRLGAAVSK